MANCPAFDPLGPYVTQVVGFVDCHSLALGVEGYRALGPGTSFGMALSGLLTIYVALIGYRLLLGGQITVREGVWAAIRLGFVLSLATQWSAYQPLVYDVVTAGPADLATRILAPDGGGGDVPGQLIERVQNVHATLGELSKPPPMPVVPVAAAAGTAVTAPPPPPTPSAGPPPLPVEARTALLSADRMLLGATLAGTLSVRVIAALLLALGPLFIACLLFDATRGLFVGWVRVLAGATLAGVAAALVIALELAVIEPQVVALQDLVNASQPPGLLPQDILATCGCFALIMMAALIALVWTTSAFRLPGAVLRQVDQVLSQRGGSAAPAAQAAGRVLPLPTERGGERSRAAQVADAARAIERREARAGGSVASAVPGITPREPASRLQEVAMASLPLGQTGRRTAQRMSPTAGRRDAGRSEAGAS